MATPPLPAKRGELRAICEANGPKSSKRGPKECSGGRVALTTARSGNVRTYMLVKGKFWCEVTAKRHKFHREIMQRVVALTVQHDWSKIQAKSALNQLVAHWPKEPEFSC